MEVQLHGKIIPVRDEVFMKILSSAAFQLNRLKDNDHLSPLEQLALDAIHSIQFKTGMY